MINKWNKRIFMSCMAIASVGIGICWGAGSFVTAPIRGVVFLVCTVARAIFAGVAGLKGDQKSTSHHFKQMRDSAFFLVWAIGDILSLGILSGAVMVAAVYGLKGAAH